MYQFWLSDVFSIKVLTIAVLSIVLTAPVGAAAIGILGPRLLEKSKDKGKDNSPW